MKLNDFINNLTRLRDELNDPNAKILFWNGDGDVTSDPTLQPSSHYGAEMCLAGLLTGYRDVSIRLEHVPPNSTPMD